jgi:hypothetical protein
VLATFLTSRQVQNLVFSSAAVSGGEQYRIYSGGTGSGDGVGGLTASGELGSAQLAATVTAGEPPARRG